MLNLNLNIIGGGIQKNKSSYDPRLFIKLLENFYTASLQANGRLTVVVSGSDAYYGERNYKTVMTSSATPSTQGEFIVVDQTTFLIEMDSGVTASFQGFPYWDVVQFGDPSIYNNVTMSLEIPEIGFSTSSYSTSSFLEHKFVANPKGTYNINATLTIDDYYNVTLNEHFFQSSSYEQKLEVSGSGSGYFIENAYTSSTSGLNNKVTLMESSSVTIKQSGVGDWGIIHNVPLSAQYSQSLVTMSLHSPYNGWTNTFGTESVNSVSFSASQFTLNNNVSVDVTASINVTNPFIPVDYLLVGGGAGGDNLANGHGGGGGGGFINAGRIYLNPNNKNSITASVGTGGAANPCPNPGDKIPTSSSLWYRDNSNTLIQLTASAAEPCKTRGGQCGVTLFDSFEWVDDQIYGAFGNGNLTAASSSACNKPSSSIVPNNSGVGGNSARNLFGDGLEVGQNGVVAIRIYDPKNDFNITLSGSNIVSQSVAGYRYWYFTTQSNAIGFNIPTQSFSTEIDNNSIPSSSAIQTDWLLVGGGGAGGNNIGGGGGGGQVLSGSYTIAENEFFITDISVGLGAGVRQESNASAYPGLKSVFSGTLQATALGGGGGLGGSETLLLPVVSNQPADKNQPGGGSGGGGARGLLSTPSTVNTAPANFINGFPGGSGSLDGDNSKLEGSGGGGGGATQIGINALGCGTCYSYGGSGSLWLDGNFYGGGGGGGRNKPDSIIATGGPGGGGNGGKSALTSSIGTAPVTGSANTGGGGGGAFWGDDQYGAAGGSGVAIFRMLTSDYNHLTASNYVSTSGSFDTYTSSSYTFLRFKSDGNLTIFNSPL